MLSEISSFLWVLPLLAIPVVVFVLYKMFLVNVGAQEIVIKERRFLGKKMSDGRVVAMKGQVGIQAEVLRSGWHFLFFPLERVYERHALIEIGSDQVGVIEAIDGAPLPQGRIFAPDEANNAHNFYQNPIAFLEKGGVKGVQMRLLPPGKWPIHPYLFRVSKAPVTVIPDGKLGIVTAADGMQLDSGKVIAMRVQGHDHFQDPEAFIRSNGQKGTQVEYLTPGRYRLMVASQDDKGNSQPGLFAVDIVDQTIVKENQVAMVEALDGAEMPSRDFVAPSVPSHDNFQDGHNFLTNGGHRGVQLDILKPGKYFINPRLFTVKFDDAVIIDAGMVGVIISNYGDDPTAEVLAETAKEAEEKVEVLKKEHGDAIGDGTESPADSTSAYPVAVKAPASVSKDMADSRLESGVREVYVVPKGFRGIQKDVLGPGKYYVNRIAYTVVQLPTTNQMVEWNNEKNDGTFDPFAVISQDGFTMQVEVRVVYRVTPDNAPYMVAKIGSTDNLKNNVLHPTTDAIFRNQASGSSAMNYLQQRKAEQEAAEASIRHELERYHVEVTNVLITNLNLPKELTEPQQKRIIAQQQQSMYDSQQTAEVRRIELARTTAQANQQEALMQSEIGVKIAEQDALKRRKQAEGEAAYIKSTGQAEAEVTELKGKAQGVAYREQVEALGQQGVTAVQTIELLAKAGVRLTPDILIAGGSGSDSAGISQALLALVARQFSGQSTEMTARPAVAPAAQPTDKPAA